MRFTYKFYAVVCGICLCLTLLPCLLWYGAVNFSTFTEEVTLTRTSPLLLLWALLFIAVLFVLGRVVYLGTRTLPAKKRRFALSLVLLLALETYLCWYWQSHYDNAPLADQNQVWTAAVAIADGEELSNASYFILLPRQKAMALMFAVVAKLFGSDYDTSIRPMNAVFLLLLVLWNALLAYRITKKEEAGTLSGLLTVLFFPLLFYTTFVYGTIPSLALVAGCFYFAVRLTQTGKARYLIPESCCAVLMVLIYSAAWIGAIAVAVILIPCALMYFKTDRKSALVCLLGAVLPLVLPYIALQFVPVIFEALTGIAETDSAAPTLTWIVMGLSSSDNTVAGPGSYNKLPETVLQDGETTEEASARLAVTLQTLLSDYMDGTRSLSFFVEKTLYQWTDPWYGSLTLTLVQRGSSAGKQGHGGHHGMGASTATGSGITSTSVSVSTLEGLQPYLVIFRTAVLILALAFVISLIVKKKKDGMTPESFCELLPAVYFAGIFLFQLFWESKSRYCMPAMVLLFPLAAAMLAKIRLPERLRLREQTTALQA